MTHLPEKRTTTPVAASYDSLSAGTLVPNIGVPTFEDAHYDVLLEFGQVWPDGQFSNNASYRLDDSQGISHFMETAGYTLTWIDFIAQAVVRVRHSTTLLDLLSIPNTKSRHDTNTLYGHRMPFGDRLYLADRTESGLVFLTEREILDEGELRPYMTTWLGALIDRGRYSSRPTSVFSSLLRR